MTSKTRLSIFLKKFLIRITEKFLFFQNSFSNSLFFLFFGFLVGNLFGTFLDGIRRFLYWDGFILVNLIFFFEIISYLNYQKKGRFFFFLWIDGLRPSERTRQGQVASGSRFGWHFFWKSLNFFKIGLMLGFFIDAFKVGS